MMGMMMRMIGSMPVKSALKYSVVPVSLTIPKLVIKQSKDKKTLAVCPTVYTGQKITSKLSGKDKLNEAAVVIIEM